MSSTVDHSTLLQKINVIIENPDDRDAKLLRICALLEVEIPYFDWVGFYLVDPTTPRQLILGSYVGAPTEHTQIPFGKGICGQAADRETTFVIQDVSAETNYLSCSPDVQSEIVVPIMRESEVLGELDIDSHSLAPFTGDDRAFLEEVCDRIATLL